MSSMKKTFSIIAACILSIIAVVLVLILVIPEDNSITILSVEKEYLLASNTKETQLNVVTFADEKDSVYFNKDSIKDTYIFDYETKEKFRVTLLDALNTKKKVNYIDRDYYQYNLSFKIDFYSSELMNINNAYIQFVYPDETNITVRIGNIVRCFTPNDGILHYTRLKGIVNEFKDKSYLCGVIIDLSVDELIDIVDIIPLSNGLGIDAENVSVGQFEYKYNTSMNDIIFGYNPLKDKTNFNSVFVKGKTSIFIPLRYDSLRQIMITSFIIKYKYDDQVYEMLVYPFKYFDAKSDYDYTINKVTYDRD